RADARLRRRRDTGRSVRPHDSHADRRRRPALLHQQSADRPRTAGAGEHSRKGGSHGMNPSAWGRATAENAERAADFLPGSSPHAPRALRLLSVPLGLLWIATGALHAAQQQQPRSPLQRLQTSIERTTRSVNATWGVYVKSLETGQEIAIDADRQME